MVSEGGVRTGKASSGVVGSNIVPLFFACALSTWCASLWVSFHAPRPSGPLLLLSFLILEHLSVNILRRRGGEKGNLCCLGDWLSQSFW